MSAQAAIIDRTWSFPYGERILKIPRPSVATFSEYSKHLESLVLRGIRRHRAEMDNVDYKLAMEAWLEGFTSGEYDRASDRFWESLKSEENKRMLFWIWVQDADRREAEMNTAPMPSRPTLTLEEVDEMWEERKGEIWGEADGDVWKPGIMWEMLKEPNPSQLQAVKVAESR